MSTTIFPPDLHCVLNWTDQLGLATSRNKSVGHQGVVDFSTDTGITIGTLRHHEDGTVYKASSITPLPYLHSGAQNDACDGTQTSFSSSLPLSSLCSMAQSLPFSTYSTTSACGSGICSVQTFNPQRHNLHGHTLLAHPNPPSLTSTTLLSKSEGCDNSCSATSRGGSEQSPTMVGSLQPPQPRPPNHRQRYHHHHHHQQQQQQDQKHAKDDAPMHAPETVPLPRSIGGTGTCITVADEGVPAECDAKQFADPVNSTGSTADVSMVAMTRTSTGKAIGSSLDHRAQIGNEVHLSDLTSVRTLLSPSVFNVEPLEGTSAEAHHGRAFGAADLTITRGSSTGGDRNCGQVKLTGKAERADYQGAAEMHSTAATASVEVNFAAATRSATMPSSGGPSAAKGYQDVSRVKAPKQGQATGAIAAPVTAQNPASGFGYCFGSSGGGGGDRDCLPHRRPCNRGYMRARAANAAAGSAAAMPVTGAAEGCWSADCTRREARQVCRGAVRHGKSGGGCCTVGGAALRHQVLRRNIAARMFATETGYDSSRFKSVHGTGGPMTALLTWYKNSDNDIYDFGDDDDDDGINLISGADDEAPYGTRLAAGYDSCGDADDAGQGTLSLMPSAAFRGLQAAGGILTLTMATAAVPATSAHHISTVNAEWDSLWTCGEMAGLQVMSNGHQQQPQFKRSCSRRTASLTWTNGPPWDMPAGWEAAVAALGEPSAHRSPGVQAALDGCSVPSCLDGKGDCCGAERTIKGSAGGHCGCGSNSGAHRAWCRLRGGLTTFVRCFSPCLPLGHLDL